MESTRKAYSTKASFLTTQSAMTSIALTPTPIAITPKPQIWVLSGTPVLQPVEPISENNITRINELARWGKGIIQDVAFSNDSQFFGIGTSIGVYLYESKNLDEWDFVQTQQTIKKLAIGINSTKLAVSLEDGTIQIWDLQEKILVQELKTYPADPERLFFVDELNLLVVSYDQETGSYFWDISTYQPHALFDNGIFNGTTSLSMDRKYLVQITPNKVTLIDIATHENLDVFLDTDLYDDYPFITAVDIRGDLITLGDSEGGLALFHLDDGSQIWYNPWCFECVYNSEPALRTCGPFAGQSIDWDPAPFPVSYVQFSPDGKYIFANVTGGRVRNVTNGKAVDDLYYYDPIISPDGQFLIDFYTNKVDILSASDFSLQGSITGFDERVSYISFLDESNYLVVDIASIRSITDGKIWSQNYWRTIISPDRKLFAIRTEDDRIEIHRADDLSLIQELNGENIYSLEFSPDGFSVVLQTGENTVEVRNVDDFSLISKIIEEGNLIRNIQFSPDGNYLALSLDNCFIDLWNIEEEKVHREFEQDEEYWDLWFSADGKYLVTSLWGGEYKIWDIERNLLLDIGSLKHDIFLGLPFQEPVLVFEENSSDRAIDSLIGWNLDLEEATFQITDHWGVINNLIVSPDGKLLLGSTTDGKIFIWRTSDWALLYTFQSSSLEILSLDISPDGRFLAIGNANGTVSLWGIPP